MAKEDLQAFLETENGHLQKLNDIVLKSIEEEKLISNKLYEFEEHSPSLKSRIADRVASFGGSWSFIILFLSIMLLWIGANLYFLNNPFDPFPFILLNLLLSTVAALQAPIIMMSQNREGQKDRLKADLDYRVNLKNELLLSEVLQRLSTIEAALNAAELDETDSFKSD